MTQSPHPLVEAIEHCLPQTQCQRCGYAGCTPYAEAIVFEQADINRCAPGGTLTRDALAKLTEREPTPLLEPEVHQTPKPIATIIDSDCIGCTLCLKACPVDAIVGAAKHVHFVIPDLCTGCELCIPPCPVDCIDLIPDPNRSQTWSLGNPSYEKEALNLRQRHDRHEARYAEQERKRQQHAASLQSQSAHSLLNELLNPNHDDSHS